MNALYLSKMRHVAVRGRKEEDKWRTAVASYAVEQPYLNLVPAKSRSTWAKSSLAISS